MQRYEKDKRIFKKKVAVTALALTLIFAVFALCACDKEEAPPAEYNLYYKGIAFDRDNSVAYAVICLTGTEEEKLDTELARRAQVTDGFWYINSLTTYSFNPSTLYSELLAAVTQDDMVYDGIAYSDLKIMFAYDTIYKSVSSDGKIGKVKNVYRHSYFPDESADSFTAGFNRSVQNSANWYTVLISAGLAAGAVAVIITAGLKRSKWLKKKEE